MKKAVTPAKLTPPASKGALPRERLFRLIEGSREKRILWISGPAGSGKTTLAASYFDSTGPSCCWYQVDEGDADLATFFYYLGQLARHAAPRRRTPLPLLTPEHLQGLPVFARRFFKQLGERLQATTGLRRVGDNGFKTIVFDNYQEVPADALFHQVVSTGLSSLPDGARVIVLSRSEPPPAYVRLRAAGEMALLGWEDIRLTAEESDAIATLKSDKELDSRTLSLLRGVADGWVAGLVLLLESMRFEGFDARAAHGLPREEIFGYFAAELFERSSQDVRDFLLETAFLPRMSARMAEALTDNPKAGRIFADLNRKNYFIHRHPAQGQVFQYHLLFRDFLLEKAKETAAPDRLREIRGRAAKVLEENGYAEDAAGVFIEAGEWGDAVRVILTHAPALISQGRWQTLQGWIKAIPGMVTEQAPWLLYWMGVSMLPISPDASRDYFGRAFAQFRGGKDATGSYLALSGMLDAVALKADTYLEVDSLILLADELLEEYGHQFPSPEIESRITASMLYVMVMKQADNPAWGYWESRALALPRDLEDKDTALRLLLVLAFHRIYVGELEKAELILDGLNKQVGEGHKRILAGGYAPISVITLRVTQACCHWLAGDFDKSRWAVADGLEVLRSTGIHLYEPAFYGYGASSALSNGEIDRAEEYLQSMHSCFEKLPSAHGETLYHLLMAWSSLLQGRFARASVHADEAIKLRTAIGTPQEQPFPHLIKAMVMHELKEDEEASQHLREGRKALSTIRLHQAEYMILLTEARIAFDRGDESSGKDLLRRAMALGREHGYANGFFWVNSTVAGLCVKALEAGIETDYVRGLIRKRNLVPDVPVQHLENWPWPLRIHTLGQFEIERDGEVVKFSGKVQQRPLFLLKALIAFGGREVKEEQLCDALWPDAEGDLAHRSFETTLYRLRQLLVKDRALVLSEGRLTLDRQACWVDAFALDQLLTEAESLWETWRRGRPAPQAPPAPVEKAMQLTRKAISMYRGHFLDADSEQLWILSLRERLRAKYTRGIESLGGYWETRGEWETAVKCYEKGLEVDDLAEEFYQHLMLCHQRLGRRARVLSVYHRCRAVLEARLGLEPSAETEALLKGVRSRP